MNNIKHRKKLSLFLVPVMVLYVFLPCIAQAQTKAYTTPISSKTLTYYCHGSTIMNTADDSNDISSYLGRDIRSVIDTDGNISTHYLIKNGKDVIAKTKNGTKLSKTYQYTPYGKTVDFASSSPQPPTPNTQSLTTNPFRYSSYYLDSESGLYYLNARYYSPELMRFISRDTYDLNNRYAYGNGNPIGNVDPNGHLSTHQWLGIAFTVLAVFSMRPLAIASAGSYLASTFTKGNLSKRLNDASYALGGLEVAFDVGSSVIGAYQKNKFYIKNAKNIYQFYFSPIADDDVLLNKPTLGNDIEDFANKYIIKRTKNHYYGELLKVNEDKDVTAMRIDGGYNRKNNIPIGTSYDLGNGGRSIAVGVNNTGTPWMLSKKYIQYKNFDIRRYKKNIVECLEINSTQLGASYTQLAENWQNDQLLTNAFENNCKTVQSKMLKTLIKNKYIKDVPDHELHNIF